MKTSIKTLSFIFFIPLTLLIFSLHSQAEEVVTAQIKDIQIIDNPYEFGVSYDKDKADEYKIINVSIDDIKERLLKSKSVHFVKKQEEAKRTIKAEWITTALKKEYGVERIDIKNAIIIGVLDFRIEDNLAYIEEIAQGSLVSPQINILDCQLKDNYDETVDKETADFIILKRPVVFAQDVSFRGSIFEKNAVFYDFRFNGRTDFIAVKFNRLASFESVTFSKEAEFGEAEFNGRASFGSAIFDGRAKFNGVVFKEDADFSDVIFRSPATFLFSIVSETIFSKNANFSSAKFNRWADFRSINFTGEANFTYSKFNGVADFDSASFKEMAKFHGARFYKRVNFASASMEKVNLRESFMTNSTFIDTTVKEAILTGVNLTGSQYETDPDTYQGSLGRIKGLATVWFDKGQQGGLVQLRAALKESGLRDLEREATYAIEHWKAHYEPWYKKFVKSLLFEWTCGYGLNYLQPLLILCGLVVVCSIPYSIAIETRGSDGIWKVWSGERVRRDLGGEELELIYRRGLPVVGYAFYFSILSAFHIGWRDLNVGSWITRIQPREYTMKATGWVRVVSGVQSLISIYLLALWILTQFGRPFD